MIVKNADSSLAIVRVSSHACWVRETDSNGFLEMPGSRTATSPDTRWYFANNPSDKVPEGLGDEDAIREIWAADSIDRSAVNAAKSK